MNCDLCGTELTARPVVEQQCVNCYRYVRACVKCGERVAERGRAAPIVACLRIELELGHGCTKGVAR
jgi:hypothetical protein